MTHRNTLRVASALLALIGSAACATTIVKRSFDDLCARAEVVFCGTVTTVQAQRDPDSGTIHTYTTFDHIEWIHAPTPPNADTYTLRTLGGTLGDERLRVDGMPRFTPGRRYLLFIRGNHRAVCPVVGWSQGCFRVTTGTDTAGNPATAGVETYAGRRLISAGPGGLVTEANAAGPAPRATALTLQRFTEAVRAGIRRTAGRRGADPP